MNKYALIGIAVVVMLGGGLLFQQFGGSNPCEGTNIPARDITVVSKELRWEFSPEQITVGQCEPINLTIVNEDDFDHGFAIDALGISQRMPAFETIYISFTSPRAGTLPFYCSVSCGDGIVDGEPRGHFDHIGRVIVEALENSAELLGLHWFRGKDHLDPHYLPDGTIEYRFHGA